MLSHYKYPSQSILIPINTKTHRRARRLYSPLCSPSVWCESPASLCAPTPSRSLSHHPTHPHGWPTQLCQQAYGTSEAFSDTKTIRNSQLVSWYFEPSQPQKIKSGLKTLFSQFPIYSAHKSSNHKLPKNHKISPDTNLQITYTNIKHKIFEKSVPSVLPRVKKKKSTWG